MLTHTHTLLCVYLLLKDVAEMVRSFCKYANKSKFLSLSLSLSIPYCTCVFLEGHHIPVSEVIDHMTSVLGHSRLGVWLGTDYSHILWQHIISVPHYVLHMPQHKWEGETTLTHVLANVRASILYVPSNRMFMCCHGNY